MASFASLRRAVGTAPRHAFIEFAMMDILMAGGAGPIFEMERQDFVGPSGSTNFVAIGARNSGVRAGQCKTRLAMFVMCLPFRGYLDVSCSFTPKSEGFQPSTV